MNGRLGLVVSGLAWSGLLGQTKDHRYDWSETKRPDQRPKNKTKTRPRNQKLMAFYWSYGRLNLEQNAYITSLGNKD